MKRYRVVINSMSGTVETSEGIVRTATLHACQWAIGKPEDALWKWLNGKFLGWTKEVL